jgi:hypothetical protein
METGGEVNDEVNNEVAASAGGEEREEHEVVARKHVREAFAQAYTEVKKMNNEVDLNSKEGMEVLMTKYMGLIEDKVEVAFLQVSDWLSEELYHQKQHLVLMQNQVDKQNQHIKKEFAEMRRFVDQEKAQRTLAQRSAREGKEVLSDQVSQVAETMEVLNGRLLALEKPWWQKCFGSCFSNTYSELKNANQYHTIR